MFRRYIYNGFDWDGLDFFLSYVCLSYPTCFLLYLCILLQFYVFLFTQKHLFYICWFFTAYSSYIKYYNLHKNLKLLMAILSLYLFSLGFLQQTGI